MKSRARVIALTSHLPPRRPWGIIAWRCGKPDAVAPVSQETIGRVEAVAQAVSEAGGAVDAGARPDVVPQAASDVYQTLLSATMMSRLPADAYANLQAKVAALDPNDQSARAQALRRQTATHRDYVLANEARTHLRWAWHAFFKDYDVLITPMMATPAFAHDQRPFTERTMTVDGQPQPYFQQIFWAGLAICSYLPATVIPTGPNAEGLPIGVQIIGPEYSDLKTIGFAKLLEAAGFAFTPPSGFADDNR